MPVSKRKGIGVIKGKVHDAGAPDRPGLPDVILTANGATAVTGQNGEFIFPALPPGNYALRVVRSSIGLDRVTECKLPILVGVQDGQTTQLDIGVIEAARVAGTVTVFPANGNGNGNGYRVHDGKAAYVVGDPRSSNGNDNGNGNGYTGSGENSREPWGLPNVLIELASGEEVLRTITDYQGQFLFEGLRPGEWRLKVYDHNLPPYHYVENSEIHRELRPAEAEEVSIEVLPRSRRIRMIEDSEDVAL